MFYITGDTHAKFGRIDDFCRRFNTSKEDVMIILGDVGLNFYLNAQDHLLKSIVEGFPITIFAIHGNHEERPYIIEGYEEKEWHGGIVYYEPMFPDLLFAKDGEIYDFDGEKVIVIGGAYSIDKQYRLDNNWPWYESEQPSDEIKEYVEQQLEAVKWKVDYVFSHTCPYDYRPTHLFSEHIDQDSVDYSTEKWLQKIETKLDYKMWYFGHYHDNWRKDKMQMLFEEIQEFPHKDFKHDVLSRGYDDLFGEESKNNRK